MANEKIILSAVDQTKAAFQSVQGNIAKLSGSLRSIAGPLAAAFSVGAVASFSKRLIDAADNLKDLSEATGVSAEELSRFGNAAQLNGASAEEFNNAIVKFSNSVGEAAIGSKAQKDAFDALGISIRDTNGNIRPTIDLFEEVANKFSSTADGAGKLSIAQDLMGRSGSRLIPVLNQGADALKKYEATFTNEFIENAGKFNDQMDTLAINLQRFASIKLTPILEGLNSLFEDENAKKIRALREELTALERVANASATGAQGWVDKFLMMVAPDSYRERIAALKEQIAALEKLKQTTAPAEKAKPQIDIPGVSKTSETSALELYNKQIASLEETLKSIKTPTKEFYEELRRLESDRDMLFDDEYLDRLEKINEKYANGTSVTKRAKTALEEYAEATRDVGKQLEDVAISGLQNLEDALVNVMMGTMSVKDAFRQMTISILADIAKILIRKSITGPLAEMIGSAFTGKAIGGPVQAGQPYIVGERGPEMFVPSQSGSIISNKNMTAAGGSTNVVVNVNMDNGTTNATDANKLGILIGNVVKGELVKQKRPGGLLAA